jgi:dTDP-glucose 4,6-dehydratase
VSIPSFDYTQYRSRTVLVTGADGFIGSHLVGTLLDLGAHVHVLVRRPREQLRHLKPLADRVAIHLADVRNFGQVKLALEPLQGSDPITVFHLAAQAHVGDSWTAPEITLETNVLGTLNMLKSLRQLNLPLHCFDYAGSSEEYGSFDASRTEQYHRREGESVYLDEKSPLNPKSIYAASKVAADFLSRNFFDAYGMPVIVTRMFNNFGPRQNHRFITGTVITQALRSPVIEIGWPHARRDFTYVEDGVRGHLAAALAGRPGEVYAFGQGRNIAIREWAELILRFGKESGYWPERELAIKHDRYRPGCTDEADLLADATRLRDLTGWQPQVSWEEGIVKTIRWYAEEMGIK